MKKILVVFMMLAMVFGSGCTTQEVPEKKPEDKGNVRIEMPEKKDEDKTQVLEPIKDADQSAFIGKWDLNKLATGGKLKKMPKEKVSFEFKEPDVVIVYADDKELERGTFKINSEKSELVIKQDDIETTYEFVIDNDNLEFWAFINDSTHDNVKTLRGFKRVQ